MQIGNQKIGKSQSVFIIAELSANHNGSLEVALETIRAAKRAGADAVKLQTYTPDTITIDSKKPDFKLDSGTIWDGQTLYELYQKAYTPWEWHEQLFKVAMDEEILCFSSPFDISAVDFLEQFDVPAYKIASFEITDIPLIQYVARKKKPIIISTGIADHTDIQLALDTCYAEGNQDIVLLKTTSEYPAKIADANLIMMTDMAKKYTVLTGLSDHTLGSVVPIVATAMGAAVIEKHIAIDKSEGVDASFSLNEKEFSEMVHEVRLAEQARGIVNYDLDDRKIKARKFARSLYVVMDVKKGDVVSMKNVKSIRPGYGLHPKHLHDIMGKRFIQDVKKGERMELTAIET